MSRVQLGILQTYMRTCTGAIRDPSIQSSILQVNRVNLVIFSNFEFEVTTRTLQKLLLQYDLVTGRHEHNVHALAKG